MSEAARIPRRGQWLGAREVVRGSNGEAVRLPDPYTGRPLADVEQAQPDDLRQAIAEARAAQRRGAEQSGHERATWLRDAAAALEAAQDEIVEATVAAIGKPVGAARAEATRAPSLLRLCAEEILRMGGHTLPLDAVPGGAGRWSLTWREPIGIAVAITPFNAPSNLLLQKVAPALATGNAVIAKPSPEGAIVALEIAAALSTCLPEGLLQVVQGGPEVVHDLVSDAGVDVVSLTGGVAAGEAVLKASGLKPVYLELGSNSPNIVLTDAVLDDAVPRIAAAAFEASGQQCISAQRIIVDRRVAPEFLDRFAAVAESMVVGDPRNPDTQIGPMVHDRAADRVRSLIARSQAQGADLLVDGRRDETRMLGPTIVTKPSADCPLLQEEVFGPVVVVIEVDGLDEAIEVANDVPGMLQASCFTSSLAQAKAAAERIAAGSVWINEATRFRLDVYPFGGYGTSGIGREGVRPAMEAFSQVKHVGVRAVVT